MSEHFLVKHAKKYAVQEREPSFDFGSYDIEHGYWRTGNAGKPSVLSEAGMRPATKKADVETGEDMKGE